jgi:hypothetical protein
MFANSFCYNGRIPHHREILIWSHDQIKSVWSHTQKKYFFNSKEEIDKKFKVSFK